MRDEGDSKHPSSQVLESAARDRCPPPAPVPVAPFGRSPAEPPLRYAASQILPAHTTDVAIPRVQSSLMWSYHVVISDVRISDDD